VVSAASSASRFKTSAGSTGSASRGERSAIHATSLGTHAGPPVRLWKRCSSTLMHAATWKVHAPSPVAAPKSQLGSSSWQTSVPFGTPLRRRGGTGCVSHSCTQSVPCGPVPGTSSLRQPASQPSPATRLPSSHSSPGSSTPLPQAIDVGEGDGVGLEVAEGVGDAVAVSVAVGNAVAVAVSVGVALGSGDGVAVGVSVGLAVVVTVADGVGVRVGVAERVAVGVAVRVGVVVGLPVAVGVAVAVPLAVTVGVGDAVGVAVSSGVVVAVA